MVGIDKSIKSNLLTDTKIFAGYVKDPVVLMNSSSGGAFTAISDYFLDKGDAVICAIYNYQTSDMEFRIIQTKSERNTARGSKYIQSKPGSVFKEALNYLKNNPEKNILFVGMGCQAEGFRKFAAIADVRDRITVVDIICHGLPSPKIWKEYIKSIEIKYGGKITELSFKDKRNGWNNPTSKVNIHGKEILLDDYVRTFYSNCSLRPSCHKCPFSTVERKTDMTIGDFWHIEEKMPNFYNKGGNSLFLIHTTRGFEIFQNIKQAICYTESNKTNCLQYNLENPTPESRRRNKFWNDYRTRGIDYIMEKYGKVSLQSKAKDKIVKILMSWVRG